MLDKDLAMLYNCKNGTKEINQAVKNNPEKFPERFPFGITDQETICLKSKVLTSKGGSRKGHTVFTEQGIAMLSAILKSKTAIKTSIKIMDTFVLMRNYISENLIEQKFINELVLRHDNDIKLLQESFDKLSEKETNNHIYFDRQIYDDTFHDRYFILDKSIIYNCGSSVNHLGTKTFCINKLEDKVVIESLLNKVNNILNQ